MHFQNRNFDSHEKNLDVMLLCTEKNRKSVNFNVIINLQMYLFNIFVHFCTITKNTFYHVGEKKKAI